MKRHILLLLALFLFGSFSTEAKIVYVGKGEGETYQFIGVGINNASEGDTVIVRDGLYDENINIRIPITLMAENMHGAIIGDQAGSEGTIFVKSSNVIVDGFIFGNIEEPLGTTGIVIRGKSESDLASGCIIRRNIIQHRQFGINVTPLAIDCRIEGNLISDMVHGIVFRGQGSHIISNNVIENCADRGLEIKGLDIGQLLLESNEIKHCDGIGVYIEGDNVILRKNRIIGCVFEGVLCMSRLNNIVISNNEEISENECGIKVEFQGSAKIDSNKITNNIGPGIQINSEGFSHISYNLISGNNEGINVIGRANLSWNNITKNNIGVLIENGAEGIIVDNSITENIYNGIENRGESKRTWIENNILSNNDGNGIYLLGHADLRGNTIEGNRSGVHIENTSDTIYITQQNVIISNLDHGIAIMNGPTAIILDNNISGNGTSVTSWEDFSGIIVLGSARILRNSIDNNGGGGVWVGEGAGDVTILDNTSINGNREGVVVMSTAGIENNDISGNRDLGIWIGPFGSESQIKKNTITGNEVGIFVDSAAVEISIWNSVISDNFIGIIQEGECKLRRNSIENNDRGIRIRGASIDLGQDSDEEAGNNMIRNNTDWNIRSTVPDTIYACRNFWDMNDSIAIDSTILDDNEDSLTGPVIFIPYIFEDPTNVEFAYLYSNSETENMLGDAYPNPFRETILIPYHISTPALINIRVIDITGRIVSYLVTDQYHAVGAYSVKWDGRSGNGSVATNGIYMVMMVSEGKEVSRKIHLNR